MARPRTRQYAAVLHSSLDSRLLNAVSEGAELLYRRLLHAVDDYGCYLGDPVSIRRFVFGHRQKVSTGRISRWLTELATQPEWADRPLLVLYEVKSQKLLQICKFFNPMDSKYKPQSLYPPPVSETTGHASRDSVRNPSGAVRNQYDNQNQDQDQRPGPTPTSTPEPDQNQSSAHSARMQNQPADERPPKTSGDNASGDIWALALERNPGQSRDKCKVRTLWLKSLAEMFRLRANTADGSGTITTLTDQIFEPLWNLEPQTERIARLREALEIARSKLGRGLGNPMGAAVAAIKKRHGLPLKREGSQA